MKKLIFVGVTLCIIFAASFVFADDSGATAPTADISVDASGEGSIFVRMGDWFATVGRSEHERARIMEHRRARRAEKHAEKAARKARKRAQKAREKAEKEAFKAETQSTKTNWKRGKGKKKGHEKARNR
jgi:hypothetical protein